MMKTQKLFFVLIVVFTVIVEATPPYIVKISVDKIFKNVEFQKALKNDREHKALLKLFSNNSINIANFDGFDGDWINYNFFDISISGVKKIEFGNSNSATCSLAFKDDLSNSITLTIQSKRKQLIIPFKVIIIHDGKKKFDKSKVKFILKIKSKNIKISTFN